MKYGLDEKQVAIYLHLLDSVDATAYAIAKDLNIPKTTVYEKLLDLEKQGLVSSHKINNRKHFTPENTDRLLQNLDDTKDLVAEALPFLKDIVKNANYKKPAVKFYVGIDGAKKVWDQMLDVYKNIGPSVVYASSHPNIFDQLPRYFPKWLKRRRTMKHVHTRVIYPESKRSVKTWIPKKDLEEVRYIADEFSYEGEITTFGDYTAILTFDKKKSQSIVIESPEITQMVEKYLKLMWFVAEE